MNVWMNMVLGLACLRTNTYRLETLVDMGTEQLLREGIREMLESLSSKELSERSVVLPLELVSLMSMQLLKDVTPSLPPGSAARLPGIYETYSSYLDSIVSPVGTFTPELHCNLPEKKKISLGVRHDSQAPRPQPSSPNWPPRPRNIRHTTNHRLAKQHL